MFTSNRKSNTFPHSINLHLKQKDGQKFCSKQIQNKKPKMEETKCESFQRFFYSTIKGRRIKSYKLLNNETLSRHLYDYTEHTTNELVCSDLSLNWCHSTAFHLGCEKRNELNV